MTTISPSSPRPLRVLILSSYLPTLGGGQLQTHLQVQEMARLGHDVWVIDLEPRSGVPAREVVDGVKVARIRTLDMPIVRALLYHAQLVFLTIRLGRRVDVAQFNHIGTALLSAAPTLGALGVPRVLVVWGSAGTGIGPFRRGRRMRLARWWARQHEHVVGLATAVCRNLEKRGFNTNRMSYIPNGVDTKRFRPRDDGDAGPCPDGWPSRGPVAICVGRLVNAKGLDRLLDAWSRLVARGLPGSLVLVGDGPLRGELQEEAESRGLADRFRILGTRQDVPELLRNADLYVSSSRTEGMSNAILEALSTGLPVVATRVGGAEDILEEGNTGYLVDSEDDEGLAESMGRLLASEDLRRRMGARAREAALSTYSISAVVQKYIDLYRQVMTG